jgi:hypothetical protein
MQRKQSIEEIISYFESIQWEDVVRVIQEREMNHMHVYVDMSLHPHSFAKVVKGFFHMQGWELYKPIDYLTNKPGHTSLYGIDLGDRANFEIYCRLRSDTALAPMPPALGERGANLRVWTPEDIKRFEEQFEWHDLEPTEEAEVAEFFKTGDHWKRMCEYVTDPDIVHVHCNVETCVHPSVLRSSALDDLHRRGWKVMHAIHCVFNGGGNDIGKIIFLGTDPELTYDIAWYHNSDVLIQRNTQETNMEGHEGTGNEFYVLRRSVGDRELEQHELLTLNEDEVERVVKAAASLYTRDSYSWRISPVADNSA